MPNRGLNNPYKNITELVNQFRIHTQHKMDKEWEDGITTKMF